MSGTGPATSPASTETVRMLQKLKLFGAACQKLDNQPFLCNNLVAYARTRGENWAVSLVGEVQSRSGVTAEKR